MRIVRASNLVVTRWKNGGGTTRVIASDTRGSAVLWRLSMADIDLDGPFSAFSGLTRVLTVIHGDGLVLQTPSRDMRADFAVSVTFDGGMLVQARLTQGPVRDLNLMYDAARCGAEATVLHGPADVGPGGPADTVAIHCIAGRARMGDMHTLNVGDTAIAVGGATRQVLAAGDSALRIVLRARHQTEASSADTAPR